MDARAAAPAPAGPALELRVHGVHGTSPASMLGTAQVGQVAGDGITGVFRATDPLPLRNLRAGTAVEAYSWGALTSGVRGVLGWVQRALWMLLLPFALVNLAYWARLHVGHTDRPGRWGATTIRWAGLLVTMMFVLTVSVVAVDLVAWQCYRYGTKSCDVLPGWLDFLMRRSPAQRIAIASLVPYASVVLLWYLSHRSLARYEDVNDAESAFARSPHLLNDPHLWNSSARTARLQRLHVAGAVATVMAFVGVQVDHRSATTLGWWTVGAVLALVVVVVLLMLGHVADVEMPEGHGVDEGRAKLAEQVFLAVVVLLAAGQLLALLLSPAYDDSRGWRQDTAWWGHNAWFIGLFLALTVVNIAIFTAGRMNGFVATGVIVLFVLCAVAVGVLGGAMVSGDAWWQRALRGAQTWWQADEDAYGTRTLGITPQAFWTGVGVALAFFVGLLVWHVSRGTSQAAHAWSGAGAAVLVGAAAWVALLFSTASVTAAAEWLNGPEQSVADLTSSYSPGNAVGARITVSGSRRVDGEDRRSVARPVVLLGSDVVVRDAVVRVVDGEAPALVRGTVETPTARARYAGEATSLELPDTVLGDARLVLAEKRLTLVDSCVVEGDSTGLGSCHPESDTHGGGDPPVRFVTKAVLKVDGEDVVVDSPGTRVRLAVSSPPQTPLVIPQVLIWTPVAQLLWALLAVIATAGCYLRMRRALGHRVRDLVEADTAIPPDSKVPATGKRTTAAFAHRAERLVEVLGAITVLLVLLLLVVTSFGAPPWGGFERGTGLRSDLAHPLAAVALYAVFGLSAGLVLLGSYLRRSESARKAVGVIWDLTTFWPRAAHPLSPPCYAERVVPELTTRIRWALRDPAATVVLSGHSQGSLICATTLMRLRDEELARVRLITYGSQVRALYGRVFPRVFGPDVMGGRTTEPPRFHRAGPDVVAPVPAPPTTVRPGTLWWRLGPDHWVNLFRRTDPLGYHVLTDGDAPYDLPVPEVPQRRVGDPGPPVMTHSGYQHSPQYRATVGAWLGETPVRSEEWTIGEVQPLPQP